MTSEIVENDDVAFAQGWQEKVLHIGAEAFAVDRAVEDAGCCELVMAECAEECEGTPMPVRSEAAQACPLGAPAPQGGRVGLDPGLIDEDEPARIKGSSPACQDRHAGAYERRRREPARGRTVFF